MDWNAIVPLIGVALGALIPLIGVVLTTRTTKAQAHNQRITEMRKERKELIVEYLRESQVCENFLSRLWRNATGLEGVELDREMGLRNSVVWLLHWKLQLVASEKLRQASLQLTERLDDAMYSVRPTDRTIWEFVDEYQDRFLEAARDELGVEAPRRRRKLPVP
jgi:hypothetical protein